MNPLVTKALEIAVAEAQAGVHEVPRGSNRGARVQEYQRRAGYGPGVAWCACFVFWAIDEAARALQASNPWIKTGACQIISEWARGEGVLMTRPAAGDVFLYYDTVRGVYRACHTGLVRGVAGGRFSTVEGNTGNQSQSEGDGVYLRSRPASGSYKFVRWERVIPALTVPVFTWMHQGRKVAELPIQQNHALVGVARFGKFLGFTVGWNSEAQAVIYNGKTIPVQVGRLEGEVVASFRELAQAVGLGLKVNPRARTVELVRKHA